MEWNDRVRCRECHGLNDAGRHYCSICGAPLPRTRDTLRPSVLRRILRYFSAFVLFLVLLAVAGGIYWAADRYFFEAIGTTAEQEETVSTLTSIVASTTTTVVRRDDRLIAPGSDRYDTAINITKQCFPDGVPALVLVAGDDFTEAITAAPLAAAHKGAVLLVPSDGITEALAAEIARLSPLKVFLVGVGRPARVTGRLEEILREPEVINLTGDDLFETAANVAEEMARKLGSVEKVVVVPSTGFADALAVGPLAAAKGWPLLLADEDGDLPRKTSSAIANLQVESALVVGLETELELDEVERQLGDDSDQTAALVAAYAAAQGLSFAHTVIVGGDNFPEALVVTPYVALEKGMMLLAKQGALPAETRALLEENLADVMRLDFIALPALAKAMATSASRETSTSTTGSRTTTTTE